MSIFSWGANSHGQLGLGFESELCITPQKNSRLPFNTTTIRSIKGGGGHVIFLDKCGRLYTCGWNNRGQLGLGCTENQSVIRAIRPESFEGYAIEEVACGWDSTAAITKNHQLFMWGSNGFQQLGLCQRGFSFINQPLRIHLPKDEGTLKISFGLRHCCVLTDDNKIYVFGRLKILDPCPPDVVCAKTLFNKTEALTIIPKIKVKMISSGQNHFVISDGKKVIGIGDNKFGQANTFEFDSPVVQVAAGWTHNGVLTKSKEIWLWGRNSYGQLGYSACDKSPVPRKLELPDEHVPAKLYLGSEHGMIRTTKGDILTWGWNEHGNCGNGDVENLYSPVLIDLPSPSIMEGTGAGFCYTICED